MRLIINALPAVLSAILFVSCQNKEEALPVGPPVSYLLSGGVDVTRMTLGAQKDGLYPLLWDSSDKLVVYSETGELLGNATLVSGQGENVGCFSLSTSAGSGTRARLFYPASASFGSGTVPAVQRQESSSPSDLSGITYAFSQEVTLSAGQVSFSLSHATAIVKLDLSCSDLPSSATLDRIVLRCPDKAVSGKFTLDCQTGALAMSETADQTVLTFTGGNPGLSSSPLPVCLAALPSEGPETYYVNIEFTCGGKKYSVPKKFTSVLEKGKLNVVPVSFSMKDCFNPLTIFIAGDSLAARCTSYKTDNYRGWGQMLQYFYNPDFVKIDNCAVGGRSTKTFREMGNWDALLGKVSAGDIVFIQFGHNDENKDERHTTPQEYKANLAQFVDEVRAKGAEPVLLTPILRNRFRNGVVADSVGDNWTHVEYAPKMHEVASEKGVVLIDALELSRSWLNGLGEEAAKDYYHWIKVGDYPSSFPEGNKDNTHLNQKGAHYMAGAIAKAFNATHPKFFSESISAPYSAVVADMGEIRYWSAELPEEEGGGAGNLPGNEMEFTND